jgi:hypothetical protein
MVDEDESVDLSFGLEGKVTVVTGGAAGIGAAIARAFVAKGARVALVDRDIDTARAHARNLGENARAFQCDVADPSSAENAVRSVLTEFGHMDMLANCAGMVVLAPAEDLTPQMWDTTLAVNLTGTFLMSQQVGRAMLEAGGGKIINIASQAASIGLDQHAAYCALKGGRPWPRARWPGRLALGVARRAARAVCGRPGCAAAASRSSSPGGVPGDLAAVPLAISRRSDTGQVPRCPGLTPSRIRRWCAHRVPVDAPTGSGRMRYLATHLAIARLPLAGRREGAMIPTQP